MPWKLVKQPNASEIIEDIWRRSRETGFDGWPCLKKGCRGFCAHVLGWAVCFACGSIYRLDIPVDKRG